MLNPARGGRRDRKLLQITLGPVSDDPRLHILLAARLMVG